jgi:hypothetical protein
MGEEIGLGLCTCMKTNAARSPFLYSLGHVALVRTDVSEEFSAKLTNSCHPDYGSAKFLRNVGSYKSHTA